MPRKPQQRRSKETVNAIVQAGFISLSRHGMEGTTTRHIAEIAGISVGSLYEYFANKEAVFDAMYQHAVKDIVAIIRPLTPKLVNMEIREAVITLLREFRAWLLRDNSRYLSYVSYTVHMAHRDNLEPINKMLMELVVQYVMHHPHLLKLPELPTKSYIIINGGIFTIIRHLAEPNPVISFDQLVDGLGDMVAYMVEGSLRELEASGEH